MPGILGYFGNSQTEFDESLLSRMARALEPEDRFKIDLYQEPSLGLGRVTLGIANPEPQPIWNEDESICVFMEGELYDYQQLKQGLVEKGHHFRHHNDVEFLLHLYEEYGDEFDVKLNGAFIATIWDKKLNMLLIVNDRLGLYPLYYADQSNYFIFGSGIRALLVDPLLPRDIDEVAIAEFLTFDHLLNDQTLLSSVHLLPPASRLTYVNNQLRIQQYWKLRFSCQTPFREEEEYISSLESIFYQAVTRQNKDDLQVGILLSGGLDSRLLVHFLREVVHDETIHSFTWGIPGCDDARAAREVASIIKSKHHFHELKPDWLIKLGTEGVRQTDGCANIVNLHALANLEAESYVARVIYKGFMGGNLMGWGLDGLLWTDFNRDNFVQLQLHVKNKQGLIVFPIYEQQKLYNDIFLKKVKDGVMDAYRKALSESDTTQLADQKSYFNIIQRARRKELNGVEVVRSRAHVRAPYTDIDLIDFIQTVPPGFRIDRILQKHLLIKVNHQLGKIPFTGTGMPLMECARSVGIRARNILRWHLNSYGLIRSPYPPSYPYADYNGWFRVELRNWVEEILLSKYFLNRGYFQPTYIRNLIQEHLDGKDYGVHLGALISLELWHRQFVD